MSLPNENDMSSSSDAQLLSRLKLTRSSTAAETRNSPGNPASTYSTYSTATAQAGYQMEHPVLLVGSTRTVHWKSHETV